MLKAGGICALFVSRSRKEPPGFGAVACLKFPDVGPKTSQIQGKFSCERLGWRNWGRGASGRGCLRSVWPSGSMVSRVHCAAAGLVAWGGGQLAGPLHLFLAPHPSHKSEREGLSEPGKPGSTPAPCIMPTHRCSDSLCPSGLQSNLCGHRNPSSFLLLHCPPLFCNSSVRPDNYIPRIPSVASCAPRSLR